jgi:hypothetical protein
MTSAEMAAEYIDGLKRFNDRRAFDNERQYVVPVTQKAEQKIEHVIEDLNVVPVRHFKRRRLTEDLMGEVRDLVEDVMRKRGMHIDAIGLYGHRPGAYGSKTLDAFESIILQRCK